MLKPNLQGDSVWSEAFGRWLGHATTALICGISALAKVV